MPSRDAYLVPTAHGVLKGSASAAQMPDLGGKRVILKALGANTGSVFVGLSSSVTASHTATNQTTGLELDASDVVEIPLPKGGLTGLWYICDGVDDDLTYMVLS